MCVLGAIMVLLTVLIMIDAVRKWIQILSKPAPAVAEAEMPQGAQPVMESAGGE
jgi:hypothetical protein